MKIYIWIISSILLLTACKQNKLEIKAYLDYVRNPKNGLLVSKEFENHIIEAQYKPNDLVALQEYQRNELKSKKFENFREETSGLDHFLFRIRSKNNTDILKEQIIRANEPVERVEYFSLYAQKDFKLVSGSDTLSCGLYHFERTYGTVPYLSIVLAFDSKNIKGDKILIYQDHVFGHGEVSIKFKYSNLNTIPGLKF